MTKSYKTERLILKTIDDTDQAFIYKHFSNDQVNKYLFDAEPLTAENQAMDIINFYQHTKPKNQERFIILLNSDKTPIGTLGYHALNQKEKTVDIGYDLNPDFIGNGYMREALTFLINHIKEIFKGYSVHACIYKDNLRSIQAVEYFDFIYYKDTYEHFRGNDYLHHIYRLKINE